MEVITLNLVILVLKNNNKNNVESDSDIVRNFSAELESESIYALYDKSTLVSHLGVKMYRSLKKDASSILTRNKETGRMELIILKKIKHQSNVHSKKLHDKCKYI